MHDGTGAKRGENAGGGSDKETDLLRMPRRWYALLSVAFAVTLIVFVVDLVTTPFEPLLTHPEMFFLQHLEDVVLLLFIGTFLGALRSLNRSFDIVKSQKTDLQEIMSNSLDAVLVVDDDGEILFANPAGEQLFSVPPGGLIHRTFGHPITRGQIATITIPGTAGDIRYGDMRAARIVWEGTMASVVTIRDETQGYQTEMRLAESERRFRQVLESVSMIAIQLDTEGNLVFCNDYFLEVAGYRREEVLGKNWFATFLPEDIVPDVRKVFNDVMNDIPEARRHTNEITIHDGRRRLIEWNGVLTYDEHGEPDGVTSIGIDITEEREAKKALEESEARYRGLFNNMINGFTYHRIITDEKGTPVDYQFLDVNDAAANYIGLPKEEIIGRRVTEVIPGIENDATDWIGIYGAVALTGKPKTFRSLKSGPLERWYDVSAYSDRKGYFATVFDDISEQVLGRQRLEWELKVDTTLARLSHEILSYDGDSEKPLLDNILHAAQKLTESEIGFVGHIDEKTGYLVVPTLCGGVYKNRSVYDKPIIFEKPPGLLGWVITEKVSILTNDPSADSRFVGTPEGHVPITRFLGVPAMVEGTVVGEIGLANAKRDYNDRDLDVVGQLATLFALALDRLRTRRALQDSDAFLRNLMNAVPRPIAYRDGEGRFVLINASCEEFIGMPSEKIIGKTWRDFISSEEAAYGRRLEQGIFERAEPLTYEARYTFGDRAPRDVLVTKVALRNTSGEPLGIISVHFDITDIKKTERTLRDSEARFRAIAESAQLGIVQVNDGGEILYWNKASEAILGYTAQEAVGKKFYDLYAKPEMRDELIEQMRRLRKDGGGVPRSERPLEMAAIRKDGADRLLEMSLALFRAKERWNVVGIFQDISEKAEQERWLQELFFAVEQSVEAVMITDTNARIVYANQKYAQWTGNRSENVVGQNICPALFKNPSSAPCESIKKAVVEGKQFQYETNGSMLIGGDEKRWFIFTSVPIFNPQEELIGSHVMLEDVTEQREWARTLETKNRELLETVTRLKETQSQLVRSEKLASLGQLSAGVAHEIKNPLNIISMNAQLAAMAQGLPDNVVEGLATIEQQVARAVKITENLREFARERKPEIVRIDLQSFLEKTIALVEYEMNVGNLFFERRFGDIPFVVMGDPDQLAQVFLNVIGNARDALTEKQNANSYEDLEAAGWKGTVTIALERHEGMVTIAFVDTGAGMTAENMEKVFDPFFTTKGEGKGTGLGLSIAYGIVENHGGKMSVSSTLGEGTEVRMALPLSGEIAENGEAT